VENGRNVSADTLILVRQRMERRVLARLGHQSLPAVGGRNLSREIMPAGSAGDLSKAARCGDGCRLRNRGAGLKPMRTASTDPAGERYVPMDRKLVNRDADRHPHGAEGLVPPCVKS